MLYTALSRFLNRWFTASFGGIRRFMFVTILLQMLPNGFLKTCGLRAPDRLGEVVVGARRATGGGRMTWRMPNPGAGG